MLSINVEPMFLLAILNGQLNLHVREVLNDNDLDKHRKSMTELLDMIEQLEDSERKDRRINSEPVEQPLPAVADRVPLFKGTTHLAKRLVPANFSLINAMLDIPFKALHDAFHQWPNVYVVADIQHPEDYLYFTKEELDEKFTQNDAHYYGFTQLRMN